MIRKGAAAAWAEEADANQAYKGALSGGGVGWAVHKQSCAGDLSSSPKSPYDPFYPRGTPHSLRFSFVVTLIRFLKTLNILKCIIKV